MKRKILLSLLALTLLLLAAIGMVACSGRDNTPEEEEQDTPEETFRDVNYYLAKVNDGLTSTVALIEPEDSENALREYSVRSQYTLRTGVENYTITFYVNYGENVEKNKYYLKVFDNDNHINRLTLYYDSTDLYLFSDVLFPLGKLESQKTEAGKAQEVNKKYRVTDFNAYLLYGMLSSFMDRMDLYRFFYGDLMQTYFRRGSLLTSAFDTKNCQYNPVGNRGEAVYFKDGDFTILIATLNSYIEAFTEGVGTSFDALTYNMLGFKLSKLFEYTFNSINVKEFRFLLTDGRVYHTTANIVGRMLDGTDYAISMDYEYDVTVNKIEEGEHMKTAYEYDKLTPGTGSFEGEIVFPTVRDDPYLVSLDYDLNAKDNSKNRMTFRIYDQRSTESEVTEKYANISEFLSVYYYNELLYVNAEGLCDFIGTPMDLESLHLPKVYFTEFNMSTFLQVLYGHLVRVLNVLTNYEERQKSKMDRDLFESIMEAVESPDLKTFRVTLTEELVKEIRGDDTSVAFLISRWLTGNDETLSRVLPNDFFQTFTLIGSYKFIDDGEDNIILQGIYQNTEYFNGTFYRIGNSEIVFPKNLNELYYTVFSMPDCTTLDYDVSITPYHTTGIDAGKFFGIFLGDSSGKNTPCYITSNQSIQVRGKVSESFDSLDAEGERVTVTTVNLAFYKREGTEETLLMTVVSNPAKTDELLVYYNNVVGPNAVSGLRYRISTEAVKAEMEKLTDENNLFFSQSNMAILFGLMSTLGGNSESYVRDNRYVINVMTSEDKDPINELIGIENTFTEFRIKVSFSAVDLSSVTAGDYSLPFISTLSDVTVKSIYSDNSQWKEQVETIINSRSVPMYLTYTEESTKIETGVEEYHPTAYLYGYKISYKLSILEPEGTYLIADILSGREVINHSYAYTMVATGKGAENKPSYLLIIDPAYTKTLPEKVDVRYDNFEVGSVNCVIEGFIESNITRDGYNMCLLAGDYEDDVETYMLRIGSNSIATNAFWIYVAVLNRNVVTLKQGGDNTVNDATAFVNNEKVSEDSMGLEIKSGSDQYTVVNQKNVPVVGEISVDPYTHAMKSLFEEGYDLIINGISEQQMKIVFFGFYGTEIEEDETTKVDIEYNKYYNKEGYNYIYLLDRVSGWTFDYSLITWQGGLFYATATFGDENGYAIPIALRINVKRKEVAEVCIDDESNSRYTIDYLIESTYSIPMNSSDGHTVLVKFTDGTTRTLVADKPGTVSNAEYFSQYLQDSLKWAGTETLKSRITVQGTSSLFGNGQNATSVTSAPFGSALGVGLQTISLNVLQPSRYLSSDEETSRFIVKQYTIGEDNKETPNKGQVRISNAKFYLTDSSYAPFEINPYDFARALPTTVWLYVNVDSNNKEWKNYKINWQTTDKEGNELHLIAKRSDGRFGLAYPSTEQRDLAVYGCIGDGNGYIWVTMIVRNLYSDLRDIKFYSYTYDRAEVSAGSQVPEEESYYEYFVDGYAPTEDATVQENKIYYERVDSYVRQTVQNNETIVGSYYEEVGKDKNGDPIYSETTDARFLSTKTYYKRVFSYSAVTTLIVGGTIERHLYEHIIKGYGLTEDDNFSSEKEYYLLTEHMIAPDSDYIYIDPYDDYIAEIPVRFEAVLGSGARVTSEDIGEDDEQIGLTWFVINEDEEEEFPLIRSGKFLAHTEKYDKYYDENGRYIFKYNMETAGLRCYIIGSGNISNEATVAVVIRRRELYYTVNQAAQSVYYIDIYNNDNDIYDNDHSSVQESEGIYAGKAEGGYLDVDRYEKNSEALLVRLEEIREQQQAGKVVYVGVRFSSSNNLYSLPVVWDLGSIARAISVLEGDTMTNEERSKGGIFLEGDICAGTVNKQRLYVPISVRSANLSSIKLNYAATSTSQGVYSIVNDNGKNNRLELGEMTTAASTMSFQAAYRNYTNNVKAYSTDTYGRIIYFDLAKAYALADKDGYFCTPYEYLCYLFSGLTLYFEGGGESNVTAGGQLRVMATDYVDMTKEDVEARLIEFFNRSVLGLEEGTRVEEFGKKVSYSFIELYKFSEGSAVARTLIIIRAEVSKSDDRNTSIMIEPFERDLTMRYGVYGYQLPKYITLGYTNESNEHYTVRYKTNSWTPDGNYTDTIRALGSSAIETIPETRIDVINGAAYKFVYTLPCSLEPYSLEIKIPRKDMAVSLTNSTSYSSEDPWMSYSAEQDIYVIENGVLLIENPFLFFYYDYNQSRYTFDKSRIPTTIYANITTESQKAAGATHVYERSTINSYEVNWKFVENEAINETIFSTGGYFLLATCTFDSYVLLDTDNNNLRITGRLELYAKVAQLEYYGIKEDKDKGIGNVTYNDASEGRLLKNTIVIDPYASDSTGKFTLPTTMTFIFNSVFAGETGGSVVEYTISNLRYPYADLNVYRECTFINYNESGHTMGNTSEMSPLNANLNTIRLKVRISFDDENNLRDDVTINVNIMSRIIEESRIYNNVYNDGIASGIAISMDTETTTYNFSAANVTVGNVVPANTYYVYNNRRFELTTDSRFVAQKTYYIRYADTTSSGSLYKEVGYYEEGASGADGRYTATKAITPEGEAVSTTYYRAYTVLYKPESELAEGGRIYYELNSTLSGSPGPEARYYTFDYRKGYYVGTETGAYYITQTYPVAGTPIGNRVYCEKTVFFPEMATVATFVPTLDTVAKAGKEYYSISDPVSFSDKLLIPTNAEYYFLQDEHYVLATGYFDGNRSYYSFTKVNLSVGGEETLPTISGRGYYERSVDYTEFEESVSYYVPVAVNNATGISNFYARTTDKDTRLDIYQTTAYSSNLKLYTMHQVVVQTGYRLAEKYYIKHAGRYEQTTDTVFNKSQVYYIFRESNDGNYRYFSGYESVSYYADANTYEEDGEKEGTISIYYIDPYNTSTFRLPTEVSLRFRGDTEFGFYTVRGWEEPVIRNNQIVWSEFDRYDNTNSSDGWNKRFYEIVSDNRVYGYFMPQESDYAGATYLVRGYISVGDSKQPFDVLIVVLNRSLRISEELQQQYSLTYDYDDPVAALLSDIPIAMGEDMFVLYDGFYVDFVKDGIHYVVSEENTYGYNNGNTPVVPTILWKEEWEYNGITYDFNSVSLTGYDGPIQGTVYASDYNLANLYDHYYQIISEQYNVLIKSWMWDLISSSNYSGKARNAIDQAKTEMENDIILYAYDMLCNDYLASSTAESDDQQSLNQSNLINQQYYTYITQSYYNELLLELRGTSAGIAYTADGNRREILLYMYQKMKASYDEWAAANAGNLDAPKTGRVSIYVDWKRNIDAFRDNKYLPSTPGDDIQVMADGLNAYQKLKASYYDLITSADSNNFSNAEQQFNKSYWDKYMRNVVDCIYRDVWDSIYAIGSIVERTKMESILNEVTNINTATKSQCMRRLITEYQSVDGIGGEQAEGYISIPVLQYHSLKEYVKVSMGSAPSNWSTTFGNYYVLRDGEYVSNDNNVWDANTDYYQFRDVNVVYFSPFDFNSVSDSFLVEFYLDYSDIYTKRIEQAEEDTTAQYRENYSAASLKELENVLVEKGIDSISPVEINNAIETIVLEFNLISTSSEASSFTYQNYMDALRTLYKAIDGSSPATDPTALWTRKDFYNYLDENASALAASTIAYNNYYIIHSQLWTQLRAYYEREALKSFNHENATNNGTVYTDIGWKNLRDTYLEYQKTPDPVYKAYYVSVVEKMDEVKGAYTLFVNNNPSTTVTMVDYYPELVEFIVENYPEIVNMNELYNDEETIIDAYGEICDDFIHSGETYNFIASVESAYSLADSNSGSAMIFYDMYNTLNDKRVLDVFKMWIEKYNDVENGDCKSQYSSVEGAAQGDQTKALYIGLVSNSYPALTPVLNFMYEFLTLYWANDWTTPFDGLCDIAGSFNFSRADMEKGAQWITTTEEFSRYRDTLVSTFDALEIVLSAETLNDLAHHLFYSYFYQSTMEEGANKARIDRAALNATKKIKSMAVQNLINANKELKESGSTDQITRATTVLQLFEDFFNNPKSKGYTGDIGKCCLASRAMILLMDQKESASAGIYLTDYEERSEAYAEERIYENAYETLERLYSAQGTVFNTFYKVFLKNSYADTSRAYAMIESGGKYYPPDFSADGIGQMDGVEVFNVTKYFESVAEELFNKYEGANVFVTVVDGNMAEKEYSAELGTEITEKYLKISSIRSILYYYNNVATELQKRIVEEVVHRYYDISEFTEEDYLRSMLSEDKVTLSTKGKDCFLALLGRHDLGTGFRDQLYDSYYAFYLEQGYDILMFAVEDFRVSTSNSSYSSIKTILTERWQKIWGWTQPSDYNSYISDMTERAYRDSVKNDILNIDITSDGNRSAGIKIVMDEIKQSIKDSFIRVAYGIYYTEEYYKEELDSILDFIVHPGVDAAYVNAVQGSGTFPSDSNETYYSFSEAVVDTGAEIPKKEVYYNRFTINEKIIYLRTTDTKFIVGQTYYMKTLRSTVSSTISASSGLYVEIVYYQNESRYNRVEQILKITGTNATNRNYPVITRYYRDVFEQMEDNIVNEKLSVYYDAVDMGIEKSIYEDLYDSLTLLTLSADKFAQVFYFYLTGTRTTSDALLYEYVYSDDAIIGMKQSLEDNWWATQSFSAKVGEYFGIEDFVLSDLEKELFGAVFMQLIYKYNADASIARAAVPQTVYRLLQRIANYRDAKEDYKDKEPISRAYLLKQNILSNDYSVVTIDYKYYYIDILLHDEYFMAGLTYEEEDGSTTVINSVSFMQSTFLTEFDRILAEKAIYFSKVSGTYSDSITYASLSHDQLLNYIKVALIEKGYVTTDETLTDVTFKRYLQNVLMVMSHTSVYGGMDLGCDNPLKDYFDKIYIEITGAVKGSDTIGGEGDSSKLGRLSLGYYVKAAGSSVDYEYVLYDLLEARNVTVTFYSEDHLTSESEEDQLRHVIYFNAGRGTSWLEFDPQQSGGTASPSLSATVYFANSRKTYQTITFRDTATRDDYKDKYVNDYTPYTVLVDANLPVNQSTNIRDTKVEYSSCYKAESVSLLQKDITEIHVSFGDSRSNLDTIIIDVLDPAMPSKVHVFGYVNGKYTDDLGYIPISGILQSGEQEAEKSGTFFSEQFSELPFNADGSSTDEQYSREVAITSESPYYISIEPSSGRDRTKVKLMVRYLNRSIDRIYVSEDIYSETKMAVEVDDVRYYDKEFFDLYDDTRDINVLYIQPAVDDYIIEVTKGKEYKYNLPSEVYVVYGNGEGEFYTNVKWDESVITYSLSGTGDAVLTTKMLSYRLQKEDGTYFDAEFNYTANTIHLVHKSASDEELESYLFGIDGTIDWKTKIRIANQEVRSIRSGDGNTVLGEISEKDGVIDCTSTRINQFYPEFPLHIRLMFNGGTYAELNLKNSDWVIEDEPLFEDIIKRNSATSEFVAIINYWGNPIRVRFNTYDNVDITSLTQSENDYLDGGTIYLIYNPENNPEMTAQRQLEKFYSKVYFNFGSEENPNWMLLPLTLSYKTVGNDSNAGNDDISTSNASSLNTRYTIRGYLGVSDTDIISENIQFDVYVVDIKLFALLYGDLNESIIYDYFSYAHDQSNSISTSVIDAPARLGDYFVDSADTGLLFVIQSDEIRYDFMNGIAYIPLQYDMSNDADSRLALNIEGDAQFRVELQFSLYSYLNTALDQYTGNNTENVFFDKRDYNNPSWSWATDLGNEDAIYWKLGEVMKASDLPTGTTINTGESFRFYWDLSDINVNLATDDAEVGYTARAYYYAANGRWFHKELTVYIKKEDKTREIIINVTGNSSTTYIGSKTYDAQHYQLNFNASGIAFIREDGSRQEISTENFTIEYRNANADENSWSATQYPRDAGTYYIRIMLSDYNYYLRHEDENDVLQDYITFIYVINPYTIDIDRLLFLDQAVDSNTNNIGTYIETIYSGEQQSVVYVEWFESAAEREAMYNVAVAETATVTEAQAYVYDRIMERVSQKAKQYLQYLLDYALTKVEGENEAKAYVYYNYLTESILPHFIVDGWFQGNEKDTLVDDYMMGRGPGEHANIKYSETEAKSLAYLAMYNRVNAAAQAHIRQWYNEVKQNNPLKSEAEINAMVYDDYFPSSEFRICEVKLHIEYSYNGVASFEAPTDVVDIGYRVEISVVPSDGNYGNYISVANEAYELEGDPKDKVGYTVRTLEIKRDENITYELIDVAMGYNGKVQNPGVSPVTDSAGNVRPGVTIRYEYALSDGLLVVERTSEGTRIVRSESTSSSTLAGIRDVGSYNVVISIDGGNNYKSMTDPVEYISTTVGIVAADIFIELDNVESYYQEETVALYDLIRIHNGEAEWICGTCGATLESYLTASDGIYRLYCPQCPGNVRMEADLFHMTATCYCNECVRNRTLQKAETTVLENITTQVGAYSYRIYCPNSKTSYLITLNYNRFLGAETLENLGDLLVGTEVEAHYPIGSYRMWISGIALDGSENAYTYLGNTYSGIHPGDESALSEEVLRKKTLYGDYYKLELLPLGMDESLYNDQTRYASIIQMFGNYNIYIRQYSKHAIINADGGIGISGDEELAERLNALSDGDTAVFYLAPKRSATGDIQAYSAITIDKDVNLTLIGYYNAATMEIESILSGITLNKGTLTLRIIEVRVSASGGRGLYIGEKANSVRTNECLFTISPNASLKDTVGIYVTMNYKEKLNIGSGTRFEGLTTGILLEGGSMEIKGSFFNNNNTGIYILSMSEDINVQQSTFTNHINYGIITPNSDAIILNNEFNYNGIAIKIPEVKNNDMYKNVFTDEDGNRTNTQDIVIDDEM